MANYWHVQLNLQSHNVSITSGQFWLVVPHSIAFCDGSSMFPDCEQEQTKKVRGCIKAVGLWVRCLPMCSPLLRRACGNSVRSIVPAERGLLFEASMKGRPDTRYEKRGGACVSKLPCGELLRGRVALHGHLHPPPTIPLRYERIWDDTDLT